MGKRVSSWCWILFVGAATGPAAIGASGCDALLPDFSGDDSANVDEPPDTETSSRALAAPHCLLRMPLSGAINGTVDFGDTPSCSGGTPAAPTLKWFDAEEAFVVQLNLPSLERGTTAQRVPAQLLVGSEQADGALFQWQTSASGCQVNVSLNVPNPETSSTATAESTDSPRASTDNLGAPTNSAAPAATTQLHRVEGSGTCFDAAEPLGNNFMGPLFATSFSFRADI